MQSQSREGQASPRAKEMRISRPLLGTLSSDEMASRGLNQSVINARLKREQVASSFSEFIQPGADISRERLRERMQKAAIIALMEAIESGDQSDIREDMKVLASLSGMLQTKVEVSGGRGYTDAQLDEFRSAGKQARSVETQAIEASADVAIHDPGSIDR